MIGLNRISGGLLFFLLVCFSSPAWSQDSPSAKQKAIELSLNQEATLLQCEKDMNDSRQAIERLKQELKETQRNDKQRIDELQTQLEERKKLYKQQEAAYSELLKSIEQSERSLKASRSDAMTWIWIAGATAAGGIAGAALNRDSPPLGSAIGAAVSGGITWLIREGGQLLGWW